MSRKVDLRVRRHLGFAHYGFVQFSLTLSMPPSWLIWEEVMSTIESCSDFALRSLPTTVTSNSDMKSGVVMVAIVLIVDFIFMFLCLDMALYIWDIYIFYMSHYSG